MKKNQIAAAEQTFIKPVSINGFEHNVKIVKDDSCDEYNYYLKDDAGAFCTRISDAAMDEWLAEEPMSFENVKDFVEYFGDRVEVVIPNGGRNFVKAARKYGTEYVNLICNEIVVMAV